MVICLLEYIPTCTSIKRKLLPLQELKLKDEQCEKLSRVRNELEAELEELTASLFQVCL